MKSPIQTLDVGRIWELHIWPVQKYPPNVSGTSIPIANYILSGSGALIASTLPIIRTEPEKSQAKQEPVDRFLTQIELDDIRESRRERELGLTTRFDNVEELLEDLHSD